MISKLVPYGERKRPVHPGIDHSARLRSLTLSVRHRLCPNVVWFDLDLFTLENAMADGYAVVVEVVREMGATLECLGGQVYGM
jgi:hypothetical protein